MDRTSRYTDRATPTEPTYENTRETIDLTESVRKAEAPYDAANIDTGTAVISMGHAPGCELAKLVEVVYNDGWVHRMDDSEDVIRIVEDHCAEQRGCESGRREIKQHAWCA